MTLLHSEAFSPTPSSLRRMRHVVAEALEHVIPDPRYEVLAVMNELAVAALQGPGGDVEVRVSFDGFVLLEVEREAPFPADPVDSLSAEVIEGFSIRWGEEQTDRGRLLWAEVEL